jgi:hypothetical protein
VEKAAFRRARPHLRAISEEQILEIGEDASLPIANWLTVHLQASSDNPADGRRQS